MGQQQNQEKDEKIKLLKLKCNMQLDRILDLEKTLQTKGLEADNLLKKIEAFQAEKEAEKTDINSQVSILKTLPFFKLEERVSIFAQALITVLQKLDQEKFVAYKNDCRNAREFYRVKKLDFERVSYEVISKNNYNNFLRYCASIGAIKSKNQECIFNDVLQGKAFKIILVRKDAYEYINDGVKT